MYPSRRLLPMIALLGPFGLLLALAGARAPAASAAVVDATVIIGGYEVFASVSDASESAGQRVVARLTRDGQDLATSSARARDDGSVALPLVTSGTRRHRPVRLQAGDHLTLAVEDDPAAVRSLTLPPLRAAVTPDGLLSGTAPPGTLLTVTAAGADGRFARFNPVADAAGRWTVDPAPRVELGAGTSGAAFYSQDDVLWQATWAVHAIRADAPDAPTPGDGAFTAPLSAGATSLWLRMASGVTADAVVTGPDGQTRARGQAIAWSGGGAETRLVLRDARGRPDALRPGDALDLAFDDGGAYTAALPAVGEIVVAPAGDHVSGIAAPGTAVAVWPIGAAQPMMATADDAGAWAADIAPASGGTADAGGVDVVVGASPGVRVRAYPTVVTDLDAVARAIRGRGVAGEPLTLTVDDALGAGVGQVAGAVGADGHFALTLFDAQGTVQPLAPGDRLALTSATGPAADWLAAPLLPQARAGRDVVEGAAAPGSAVTVTVGAVTRTARADDAGAWRADFDEAVDLEPGTSITVAASQPGGPIQRLTFPVFRASVQSRGASARIEGPPGLSARVEVARDGAQLAAGACTIARTACMLRLEAPDGGAVALAPGDEVLVIPNEDSPAALDVIELAAHIDRSGSDVAGASPPNENVRVAFTVPPGRLAPQDAVIGADFNGVFDYELGRAEWELLAPGIRADVYYTLPSGHQVFATAVVEQVILAHGGTGWDGLAEPGATVDGTLARDGRALASASATASTDGTYSATLRDAAGAPVTLVPGDVLTVADGRRRVAIDIPPLVAWFADGPDGSEGPTGPGAVSVAGAPDGAVIGWSAPERPVRVEHYVAAAPGDATVHIVTGLVDANGTLSLGDAPLDPNASLATWLALTLASGDELRARLRPASSPGGTRPPGRVMLPVGWR